MTSIALTEAQRKDLIRTMKRETKPSRKLRMHIVLLAADGHSPSWSAQVLYCSRTTIYTVTWRFAQLGPAAFDDAQKRGPQPRLDRVAQHRLETLVETELPLQQGWLRSRWSCLLLTGQLLKERHCALSEETVRRTLQRLGFVWRRARPVPLPRDPEQKRQRLLEILRTFFHLARQEGLFSQDETRLDLNPRVGFAWMRRGKQASLPTPGTNRKVWISGALNWVTGHLHWVVGPRKDSLLFLRLLSQLRRTYRCHQQLHIVLDNDGSHLSRRVQEEVERSRGRICLHWLPPCLPEANPIEPVWWRLHEAITRNHQCAELEPLVDQAEQFLARAGPYPVKLGRVYRELRCDPDLARVQLSCGTI